MYIGWISEIFNICRRQNLNFYFDYMYLPEINMDNKLLFEGERYLYNKNNVFDYIAKTFGVFIPSNLVSVNFNSGYSLEYDDTTYIPVPFDYCSPWQEDRFRNITVGYYVRYLFKEYMGLDKLIFKGYKKFIDSVFIANIVFTKFPYIKIIKNDMMYSNKAEYKLYSAILRMSKILPIFIIDNAKLNQYNNGIMFIKGHVLNNENTSNIIKSNFY